MSGCQANVETLCNTEHKAALLVTAQEFSACLEDVGYVYVCVLVCVCVRVCLCVCVCVCVCVFV